MQKLVVSEFDRCRTIPRQAEGGRIAPLPPRLAPVSLLGPLIGQLSLPASRRGRIDDLELIARDREWSGLLDPGIVGVGAALKAHGERFLPLVDDVSAKGG